MGEITQKGKMDRDGKNLPGFPGLALKNKFLILKINPKSQILKMNPKFKSQSRKSPGIMGFISDPCRRDDRAARPVGLVLRRPHHGRHRRRTLRRLRTGIHL